MTKKQQRRKDAIWINRGTGTPHRDTEKALGATQTARKCEQERFLSLDNRNSIPAGDAAQKRHGTEQITHVSGNENMYSTTTLPGRPASLEVF